VISHHERRQAIRNARVFLDRLERDDPTLSTVRRRPVKPANAPDGYPRGGDSVGGSSGHSDPTGGAVESWIDTERTRVADLVDDAWRKLIDAVHQLRTTVAGYETIDHVRTARTHHQARPRRPVLTVPHPLGSKQRRSDATPTAGRAARGVVRGTSG
jgi:hypothetical protein